MLCFSRMLLTPKWPASAYMSLPPSNSCIILKSLVATGQQDAQCKHSDKLHKDLS